MKSEFSELSFAFAYMSDLTKKLPGMLTIAPSFPSTVMEGKKGYGYDVKLGFKGIPVFLQFKLAHCLTRKSATEFAKGKFPHSKPVDPVYRFYLMALGESRQTSLMLKLERRHDLVFYVAPAFHKVSELNSHFISSSVENNSRAFRPSKIKKMPDKLEHFVSYKLSGTCYRFSENPQLVDEDRFSLSEVISRADVRQVEASAVLKSLLDILDEEKLVPKSAFSQFQSGDHHPLLSAQYLARTFFGCELVYCCR